MRVLSILSVALLASVHSTAQQASHISASTPIVTTAGVPGGPQDVQLQPPGPILTPELFIAASATDPLRGVGAFSHTRVSDHSNGLNVVFTSTARTEGGAPFAFATADANEFLFILQFPGPTYASLHLSSTISSTGFGSGHTEVDVGNDGVAELTGAVGVQSTRVPLPDAATSAIVRIRIGASASGVASEQLASVSISLQPRSTISVTTPVGTRCGSNILIVTPQFDGSTLFRVVETGPTIPVLVLGTQNLALPLPASIAPPGCVLQPSTDILLPTVPLAPGSPLSQGSIPRLTPAVPFNLYVQAVTLDIANSRVTTSNAFRLQWR